MTIEPGMICFLVALDDSMCQTPFGASFNGKVCTVEAGPLPHAKAIGGIAYVVTASWLHGRRTAVVPGCLRPIARLPAPPSQRRKREPEGPEKDKTHWHAGLREL